MTPSAECCSSTAATARGGQLPTSLRSPTSGEPLALLRAWPRSPTHLLLMFLDPHGAQISGQWFADRDRLHDAAAATPPPAVAVPEAGVLLQPAGADRRLPALAELLARPGARLLAHRPERRAVVALTGETTSYVKVVRPGRAEAVLRATDRAATLAGDVLRIPRVLHYDEGRGTVEFAELPGRTALDVGRTASPERLRTMWTAVGRAVSELHAGSTTGIASHNATDELAVTRRWLHLATGYGLLFPDDTEAATAALACGRPGPTGLLHRDLHDKQLLVGPDSGSGIGLLDVDTLAVGERALDIANLLAHLRLRTLQGSLPTSAANLARRSLLAAVEAHPDTEQRLPAYENAALLRLAAVYAFRPRWYDVARTLLHSVHRRSG